MKINILNQIINFFEWIIPLAIKHIYSFMLFMNKNIFFKLDTSLRLDAYIGVLSILVAIVIFIVELVKDSDNLSSAIDKQIERLKGVASKYDEHGKKNHRK